MAETIRFNGSTYYRYPGSKHREHRCYFSDGVRMLHREIYKASYGEIPRGFHVHHKDHNPLNNAPDNLEAIPISQHMRHHLLRTWTCKGCGKGFHREHPHREYCSLECHRTKNCESCGKPYATRRHQKFCSPACKMRGLRKRRRLVREAGCKTT